MKPQKIFLLDWSKRLLKTTALAMLLITLSLGLSGAWWDFDNNSQPQRKSALAQGDAITDPTALLRYALPIDNATVRQLQADIEGISKYLRSKRWSSVSSNVKNASRILTLRSDKLLESVPEERQPQAEAVIEQIKEDIGELQQATEAKDREQIWTKRRELLARITTLEELMLQGFPFEVPEEYANLPQLLGRATVDLETTKGDMTLVVDGYSAPVTAGNFVDLVQRGFYDDLEFFNIQGGFAIQTGNPPGSEEGFVDPDTGEYRAIPLEILVRDEEEPIYGITLEDAGIYLPDLALPFNAYGAVALARPESDPNGGSSQFFFFKFDTELTPPGFNLMDGRYSVFGYLVKGKEVLEQLTDKDKIISAKVVEGIENLVEP
ncbi:MAG: peptidylprolyl isomerase [Prochloraceae cyanobacterium]